MKIIFANSPVMRYRRKVVKDFSIENDLRIRGLRMVKRLGLHRILERIYNHLVFSYGNIRFGQRAGSRWPFVLRKPMGAVNYPFIMGYAISNLKSKGYDVEILDAIADENFSYSNFIRDLKKMKPDIVVVECSTPTVDIDLVVAKEISKFADVALAGTHLSLKCDEVKRQAPFVKYFLKGEYILSSLEMVRKKRPGVYESKVIKDLDSIPFPYRDYSSAKDYYDPSMSTLRPQMQVWGSKGCPFKCSFCLWPQTMYKGIVSLRDPKKIAEEIREGIRKHKYKSILFDDDTFNIGDDRISKLCDELKKIGLHWTMMGRLDCSPLWLLEKMIDCGCVGMRFGVETFDKKVLENINKGLQHSDFLLRIKLLSKKYPKIMFHLTMMKNLPGQTEKTHIRDMKILRDLGYELIRGFPHRANKYRHYQLSSCAPFPGTKMYKDLKISKKETLKDYLKYDGSE